MLRPPTVQAGSLAVGYATAIWLMTAVLTPFAAAADGADTRDAAVVEIPLDVAVPMLVRDAGVRRELQLSQTDERELDRLLVKWNDRLFSLRMLSPEADAEQIDSILSGFRSGLQQIFTPEQLARLKGLKLQAHGWRSLKDPAVADELKLTAAQRKKIVTALQRTADAVQKEKQSDAAGDEAVLESRLKSIQADEHEQLTATLTTKQKRRWLELVGPRYDLSTVRQSAGKAPELSGITGWLNSPPLTLEGQRGRVVVLHFIAADCINCIRNLPHYQSWHEQFADRDVTVLGVHSPETSAERDTAHVRKQLAGHGVTYPVALDAKMETWNAWTNRMWPSTYLIDKQGEVRFWWYGELRWQGAEGDRLVRERIEKLLAEDFATDDSQRR